MFCDYNPSKPVWGKSITHPTSITIQTIDETNGHATLLVQGDWVHVHKTFSLHELVLDIERRDEDGNSIVDAEWGCISDYGAFIQVDLNFKEKPEQLYPNLHGKAWDTDKYGKSAGSKYACLNEFLQWCKKVFDPEMTLVGLSPLAYDWFKREFSYWKE